MYDITSVGHEWTYMQFFPHNKSPNRSVRIGSGQERSTGDGLEMRPIIRKIRPAGKVHSAFPTKIFFVYAVRRLQPLSSLEAVLLDNLFSYWCVSMRMYAQEDLLLP